jgi:hypothetical protein
MSCDCWKRFLQVMEGDDFAEYFANAREVPAEFRDKDREELRFMAAELRAAIERDDQDWLDQLLPPHKENPCIP